MANAFATTPDPISKYTPDYALHIFRRCYMHLLFSLDAAIAAERELEFASNDDMDSIFDPSMSTYLRDAERKWDDVTDSVSALISAATSTSEPFALREMAFALKSILSSESGPEFRVEIKTARAMIAQSCVTSDASIIAKDFFQVLRATAHRLDGLESLSLYHRDVPSVQDVSL